MFLHLLLVASASVLFNLSVVETAKTNCKCGWTNRGLKRILGGYETKKNEFPWMAAMFHTKIKNVICGASLITTRHAVTANHCVLRQNPADVLLVIGAHNIRNVRDGTRLQIEKFVSHPLYYKRGDSSDDIAVIVTKDVIPMSTNVGPICLPPRRINLKDEQIKAIGWGKQQPYGPTSRLLQAVDLTVIPYDNCSLTWDLVRPQSQICTLDEGKSTCFSDIGGPLVWLDRETQSYTLAAIASYTMNCQSPPPAVHTEVAVYVSWIQDVIKDTVPAQVCMKI